MTKLLVISLKMYLLFGDAHTLFSFTLD